jgi:hypothetical protein
MREGIDVRKNIRKIIEKRRPKNDKKYMGKREKKGNSEPLDKVIFLCIMVL